MDLATLIAVVLVVLAVGAVLLGATFGAPGAVKEQPRSRPTPAVVERPSEPTPPVAPATRPLVVRRPTGTPGISATVLAGVATLALVIIALGAYFVWVPAQQTYAANRYERDSVQQAAMLYTQDCAQCHGPSGAGSGTIGSDLHVYATDGSMDPNGIAARNKLNPGSAADLATLRNLIVVTVRDGRSGTLMPAWGQQNGGPLSASQISGLADLIVTNGWNAVVPSATPATAATPATNGDALTLIQQYNCGSCHTIDTIKGANGTVGPNLSAEATVPWIPASSGNLVNTRDNMATWILNAPAVKPGVIMPDFEAKGMSLAQAVAIANYIETLHPPTPVAVLSAAPTAAAGTTPSATTPAPAAGATGAAPPVNAAAAQALITKYGCAACHTISSIPGAVGTIGPDLSKEGAQPKVPRSTGILVNTPDNLQKWILNAPQIKPGIVMPDFASMGMTADEAATIAAYLDSMK